MILEVAAGPVLKLLFNVEALPATVGVFLMLWFSLEVLAVAGCFDNPVLILEVAAGPVLKLLFNDEVLEVAAVPDLILLFKVEVLEVAGVFFKL